MEDEPPKAQRALGVVPPSHHTHTDKIRLGRGRVGGRVHDFMIGFRTAGAL